MIGLAITEVNKIPLLFHNFWKKRAPFEDIVP